MACLPWRPSRWKIRFYQQYLPIASPGPSLNTTAGKYCLSACVGSAPGGSGPSREGIAPRDLLDATRVVVLNRGLDFFRSADLCYVCLYVCLFRFECSRKLFVFPPVEMKGPRQQI